MKKCYLVEQKINDLPWSCVYVCLDEEVAKSDVARLTDSKSSGDLYLQFRYRETWIL